MPPTVVQRTACNNKRFSVTGEDLVKASLYLSEKSILAEGRVETELGVR